MAGLLFGAAAWRCAVRDRFLGWNPSAIPHALTQICNNNRFLLLPWMRVPHLASHVLAQVTARLRCDWRLKYAMTLRVMETVVQSDRFRGTGYRAANWIEVGQTTGRSRQDRYRHAHQRYRALLRRGRKSHPRLARCGGRTAQSKAGNLLDRLEDYDAYGQAFLRDEQVLVTNNQAEQDIGMIKVRQKISGCYRTMRGAEIFCRIGSYMNTCRKQDRNLWLR